MEPSLNALQTLLIHPARSLNESEIEALWKYLVPHLVDLQTNSGSMIDILETGKAGCSPGPDIQSVTIRMDGVTRQGDVEIHRQASDWYHHGHHRDETFNRVILHVSLLQDDTRIRREDQTFLENLVLEERLDDLKGILNSRVSEDTESRRKVLRRPCHDLEQTNRYDEVLKKAGTTWISWKASRLRHFRSGKELLIPLIGSLGYTQNHDEFRKFAQRLRKPEFYDTVRELDSTVDLEAYALGIGGWLNGNYLNSQKSINRSIYDRKVTWDSCSAGKIVNASGYWTRSKVRPQAFPRRRWVGFVWSTSKINTSWKTWIHDFIRPKLAKDDFRGIVHSLLDEVFSIPGNNYWNHHYSFSDPKHDHLPDPFGVSWYDQMVVNVILPYFYLRAMTGGEISRKKVLTTFRSYDEIGDNRRLSRLSSQWGFDEGFEWSGAHLQQGGVFLYKNGCREGLCQRCPLNPDSGRPQQSLFGNRR